MATVSTPAGETLEGVTGSLLDYYRGEAATVEGYTITDDVAEQSAAFPMVMQPGATEPVSAAPDQAEGEQPADEAVPVVDVVKAGPVSPKQGDGSSGQHSADETA